MAQEIDINLNVNAEQADKSLGSLKSQLREAQQDVQKLADKFGATSKEAVEASKRAADLKDRMLSDTILLSPATPVTIKTTSMQKKTYIKDKNINYTLEFDFANKLINNIV